MKALKKTMKFLAWTVGILVVLALVLALTIHWWLGPTVKGVANTFGPSVVKTSLHLGDFGLNPYSGVFHTGDFQLSNPAGFSERYAVKLGEFRVELDPSTVMNDVIHIKLVRIKDVFVSYCFNNTFTSNFTAIQEGMRGEAEDEDEGADEGVDDGGDVETVAKAEDQKKAIKVIIDRFEIESVSAKIGMVTLPLVPSQMVFTDIGKDSGGRTLIEVYDQTIGPIVKTTEPAVENAQKLAKLAVGGINQGLEIGKQGLGAAADGLGKTVDALKIGDVKGAKETIKATEESLKSAGKSLKDVGKGLKNVGSSLEDLFK